MPEMEFDSCHRHRIVSCSSCHVLVYGMLVCVYKLQGVTGSYRLAKTPRLLTYVQYVKLCEALNKEAKGCLLHCNKPLNL